MLTALETASETVLFPLLKKKIIVWSWPNSTQVDWSQKHVK